jgi:hypothetical protein
LLTFFPFFFFHCFAIKKSTCKDEDESGINEEEDDDDEKEDTEEEDKDEDEETEEGDKEGEEKESNCFKNPFSIKAESQEARSEGEEGSRFSIAV